MTRVTLHGLVPVYVVVDLDDSQVTKVVAADEEFDYVAERIEIPGELRPTITSLRTARPRELPIAYDEDGDSFDNPQAVELAVKIAEGEVGSGEWPAWNWSW